MSEVWGEGGRPTLSPPMESQPHTRTYHLDVRVRGTRTHSVCTNGVLPRGVSAPTLVHIGASEWGGQGWGVLTGAHSHTPAPTRTHCTDLLGLAD